MLADSEKSATFASQLRKTTSQGYKMRAFSSAGSEHLPYKQRVGGSNPSTPTREEQRILLLFIFYALFCFFVQRYVLKLVKMCVWRWSVFCLLACF